MQNPSSTYRSPETEKRYRAFLATVPEDMCLLCRKPSKREFTHWRIVENSFPYDRIARVHDMLLPKEHKAEHELSHEEWLEYNTLKHGIVDENYQFILEATSSNKSVPKHFHVHLTVGN
jgi:hypothetical protein